MALRIAERLAERKGANDRAERHEEGWFTKAIEKRTARLPSDTFLWAGLGAVGASVVMQAAGKKELSLFIGQWAPTLLALGIYNKMVKLLGSDPKSLPKER